MFTPHLPGTLSSSPRLPPSPGRSREKEGQRQAQRGVSFMGPPRRSPSLVSGSSAPLASPRNSPLLSVCNAGIGRKRPRDIPCVAAIWCLSPPPAVPSHSQIYTQLERGQFHALGIKTQRQTDYASPGTRCSLRAGTQEGLQETRAKCPRGNTQVHSSQGLSVNTFVFCGL